MSRDLSSVVGRIQEDLLSSPFLVPTALLVLVTAAGRSDDEYQRLAEEGQGMVEYALILVLIAIVVIVILTLVGHNVSDVFSNINNGLSG